MWVGGWTVGGGTSTATASAAVRPGAARRGAFGEGKAGGMGGGYKLNGDTNLEEKHEKRKRNPETLDKTPFKAY